MKKKIIMACLMALTSITLQAADYQYLVFTLTDGTTQSITAQDLTLTFTGGNLTAQSGTESLTIPLTSLTKMAFSNDGSTTGISTISSDGIQNDTDAEVYDFDGRRITTGTTLQRGIYIIKRNGQTTKVQVK